MHRICHLQRRQPTHRWDQPRPAVAGAALAGHVRPGGTAVTTRYVADPQTLARAGVTGVNFQLSKTVITM